MYEWMMVNHLCRDLEKHLDETFLILTWQQLIFCRKVFRKRKWFCKEIYDCVRKWLFDFYTLFNNYTEKCRSLLLPHTSGIHIVCCCSWRKRKKCRKLCHQTLTLLHFYAFMLGIVTAFLYFSACALFIIFNSNIYLLLFSYLTKTLYFFYFNNKNRSIFHII